MSLPRKFQAFPFRLYFERIQTSQGIIVGSEQKTGRDIVINESDHNAHSYVLGKSGAGKSMLLMLLFTNLLAMGRRCIFLDPLGTFYDLMERWKAAMAKEYYCLGDHRFQWFKKEFLDKTLFWDLSKKDHPYRSNLLHGIGNETLGDTISRLLKLANTIFSSSETGDDAMSIQYLRRLGITSLIPIFAATKTPMNQAKRFIMNKNFRETLIRQAREASTVEEVQEAADYWEYLDSNLKSTALIDKTFSLLTGFNQFFESRVIRNFLLTDQVNVDWQDIFDNKSLFIKLPVNDLASQNILMNYIYQNFFHLIKQRDVKKNPDILYIGADEASVVFNKALSETVCISRNKRVFFLFAHQARHQLLSEEKMRIAATIEDQCDIGVYFRVGYQDAKKIVEEKLSPDPSLLRHTEKTPTISKSVSETHSSGWSRAWSWAKNLMYGKSVQETISKSVTENFGISESQSLAQTLSAGFSLADAEGESKTWTDGSNFQITWTEGNTFGQTIADNFTLTQSEGVSTAETVTDSGTVTISETNQTGESSSSSDGQTAVRSTSKGSSTPAYTVSFQDNNGGVYTSEGLSDSVAKSFQQVRSLSQGISHGTSESQGCSESRQQGVNSSQSLAIGKQLGDSITLLKNFSEGFAKSLSEGKTFSKTVTSTKNTGESLGITKVVTVNQGKSVGETLGKSVGENTSQGVTKGSTLGEQKGISRTVGESISVTSRNIFYSMQESFDVLVRKIRDLPPRYFLLNIKHNVRVFVKTATCFDLPYRYGNFNFLEIVREYQRCLLSGEKFTMLPASAPKDDKEEKVIYKSLDFEDFMPAD